MSAIVQTAARRAFRRVRTGVISLGFIAAGCAIHPLPEDMTGVPTYIIVRQIRCETRQAVIDSTLGWLANDERVDEASRAIGQQFSDGRPIQQFRPGLFKGQVASIIQLFFDTGVAYDFELQATEVNNLDAGIDLAKPFTHSKFTLGLKGGFDRQRKNDRVFTITDTFSGLVRLPDSYCRGGTAQQGYNFVVPPNYVYPIAALTGVATRTDVHTITMGLAIAGAGTKLVAPVRTALFAPHLLTASPTSNTEAIAAEAVNQFLTRNLFRPTVTVTP